MIDSIFERDLLAQMLQERYVKVSNHPDLPLRILNYTSRAQFDGVWNDVTRACRGLIIDEHDRVVARPFTKFFTLEQRGDQNLPRGPVHVTEKLDGSLGILYPAASGHAIATRGSFTSEQARHASALWTERYSEIAGLNPAWTYLCEIVYPANRIVVDYHGLDDLILLAAIDTETGRSIPLSESRAGWPGPVVDEHPFDTAADAIGATHRTNAEGFVIHFTDDDLRVKVKHDEYVRLHRIFTDVSERRIWEALSADIDITDWLDGVPDEIYSFVRTTRESMLARYATTENELHEHLSSILAKLPVGHSRREFAEAVTRLGETYPLANAVFALADGKNPSRSIWATLRPDEHRPLFSRHVDTE